MSGPDEEDGCEDEDQDSDADSVELLFCLKDLRVQKVLDDSGDDGKIRNPDNNLDI